MATPIKKEWEQPKITMFGCSPDTEKFYQLEKQRDNTILAAAKEQGKILGHKPKTEFWEKTVSAQLLAVLDSFEVSCSLLAAKAFLEYHGYKVEDILRRD